MNCSLCKQSKGILDSHVIPEFFFKPLYDKIHRFCELTTLSGVKNRYPQKGIRQKLLCWDCEQQFSKYEDYTRRIFYGGKKLSYERVSRHLLIQGIEYTKFKLFQLSLLWRAGASELEFFKHVQLGPHQEKIRLMLQAEDPGKAFEYGVLIILLTDEENASDQFILQPVQMKIEGFRMFRFILGGAMWLFIVSSHNHQFPASGFFLQENEGLRVKIADISEIEFISGFAKDLDSAGKLKDMKLK